MQRENVRDRILDVATELFYRDGIHATGINAIIAQANVARMSLYNHFPSKEALIEAVLRRYMENARHHWDNVVQAQEKSPEERLCLFFNGVEQIVYSPDFFGCPFINTVAEYSDPAHPFHQLAIEYKQMYRGYLQQILEPLHIPTQSPLVAQIFLLIEGTLVTAQVDARQGAVQDALAAALILMRHHQNQSGQGS